jgi:hypothetical protein
MKKEDKQVNDPLQKRLLSIRDILMKSYEGGVGLSRSTKGSEREYFVKIFLEEVFPPKYRFCSGDIVDTRRKNGNQSGQVDIVVEFEGAFSYPMYPNGPRFYLAESVAVAIEVKSNLQNQWDQVLEKAGKVKSLKRKFIRQELMEYASQLRKAGEKQNDESMLRAAENKIALMETIKNDPPEEIPFFVVGYKGWKNVNILKDKLDKVKDVDAVFVIDTLNCHWRNDRGTIGDLNGWHSFITFQKLLQKELNRNPHTLSGLDWIYLTADDYFRE